MAKTKTKQTVGEADLGGFLGGLTNIIEKLGDLAEKSKDLHELKEFGDEGGIKGVYGFTIRTGIGGERNGGVKVEPFGNVRKDHRTGKATVQEMIEPLVDVFEESDHVLVVAELPGVSPDDVHVELKDDILVIAAQRGSKKYHKEVLLPESFHQKGMSQQCRNGVLEVKLTK
jgi:HSP20 family protein